jgi:signal transduction histidine kinase
MILADHIPAIGCAGVPVGLSLAAAIAGERVRSSRRRAALNRALHELRRPLQALSLAASAPGGEDGVARRAVVTRHTVDAALAALDEVDQAVNGVRRPRVRQWVPIGEIVREAADRWLPAAAARGRMVSARGAACGSIVIGDRRRLEAALDNLIANGLEHGTGEVRISAAQRGETVRVAVRDDGPAARNGVEGARQRGGRPFGRDPRRGHGLRIVAEVAREHGGRFLLDPGAGRTEAVLELPLAVAGGTTQRAPAA